MKVKIAIIKTGLKNEFDSQKHDIYTEEGVKEDFDNDEITDTELGFMIGYLSA